MHKVLQFLQEARRPVLPTEGLWNLWYNPVPKSRPARMDKPKNIPPEEQKLEDELSEVSGTPQELDLKVDESQYQRMSLQQQLNSSLDELVDEDKKGQGQEGSVSSKELNAYADQKVIRIIDYQHYVEKDPNKIWEQRTMYDYMDKEEEQWSERLADKDIRDHQSDRSYRDAGYAKSKSSARGMSSKAQSIEQPGEKRKLNLENEQQELLTPRTMRKVAKRSIDENPEYFKWIREYYPKKLQYYRGELYLDAKYILKDLWFEPTTYAPRLQTKADGRYRYDHVKEYNTIWLKKHKNGEMKRPDEYTTLIPSNVWIEDRWIFIRRMAGDTFCQKLFYKVCTFIWINNGIQLGAQLQAYQDALIEDVFQYKNKKSFVINEKEPTEVSTWDCVKSQVS